ncbi:PH domain leucine-rich repeat-containing protein phosphatase 1 [Arapaima gigas]
MDSSSRSAGEVAAAARADGAGGSREAAAPNTSAMAVKTSGGSCSLLRRRRLRRNLSAAGGALRDRMRSPASSSSSSSVSNRSLDGKALLRQKAAPQLQPADREWVREDLRRGCVHVQDRHAGSCLRPVLCTVDTMAGEVAQRLQQVVGKVASVVRMAGKGGFGCNLGSGRTPDTENKHVSCSSLNRRSGCLNALADASSNPAEEPGCDRPNSGSGVENSGSDEVKQSSRGDSFGDRMTLGTDTSVVLIPTFDRATERLDTCGSSSDELELDCSAAGPTAEPEGQHLQYSPGPTPAIVPTSHVSAPSLAPDPGAQHLRHSSDSTDDITITAHTHDHKSTEAVAYDSEPVSRVVPLQQGKVSCSSKSLSMCFVTLEDPGDPAASEGGLTSDCSDSVPTLYVQLHGKMARRLEQHEKPLQIQNDFLFKLGFKDPWRVQEEGLDPDMGSLIRFYAGKPSNIEGSERIQLSGTYSVRKGKMQLPVNRWKRRRVILCGTCLIISSVKDSQAGKMHVLPLIGGKVKPLSSSLSTSSVCSVSLRLPLDDKDAQLSSVVSQRISSADLSGCSLEQLPPNLFYSQDLTHLNLKHNFLEASHGLAELQRFTKLRSLNLSNNHLGRFPLSICSIPTLTEVNLSCNRLSSVPNAVGAMRNLQTFLLDGNQLSELPEELGDLRQLSYLGLSFNKFCKVPAVLEQLAAVERLCMAGNELGVVALHALCLLRVKHVDIRLNHICHLVPDEPDFLQHVTHLDLRDNRLAEVDASLFPRLEVLHCERNCLRSLRLRGTFLKGLFASTNEICQLEISPLPSNLTNMDVSRNCLTDLPEWLCGSTKLEVLDVSRNQLSQLPERLLCSSSLRKLLAGHNQLQKLPEQLEGSQMEVLDVQHNQLSELPTDLFLKANSLRRLNASANKLESLPPSALPEESRSVLQELYLTNNRLTEKCVPTLTGHRHLRVLHLAYNQLHSFPASKMAKLEELEELDLSGNRLKAIPTTILSCKRMHTMISHSNCIEVFPEVMQLADVKCVDLSCNELSEITLPENLPPKLQELDLTGNPRLALDHKTLEQLNNIRCFRIDQCSSSFPVSEVPGAPAVWRHGYTEASGVKNKLFVAALSMKNFGENREALYGVFDGDRNVEVPYLLQCTMGDVLAEELHKSKSKEDYMTSTFLVMQRKLGTVGQKLGGSAVLCHICHDPMDPGSCFTLTTANVGKCQAILCRDGKPLRLSAPHNVAVAEEYRRVRQHKAIVTEDNKVNGVTDSTRIMGYSFLYPSVIPCPHVQTVTLTAQDEFFILGSRGLWDCVSPAEAVEAVRNVPDTLAAAKKLCTLAQGYGCSDSLSAVVVQLSVTEDCCCCDAGPPPPPSPGLFPNTISVVIRDTLPTPSSCSEMSSEVSTSEMSSEVGSTASDEPPQSTLLQEAPPGASFPAEPRGGSGGGSGGSCALHPVCLVSSFQRQLSSATFSSALSDNGLDSEDDEPISGVFSNGSRVEVEADVHCLRAHERPPSSEPPTAESLDKTETRKEEAADESEGSVAKVPRRVEPVCGAESSNTRSLNKRRGNGSVAPQERSHNLIEIGLDAPARKPGGYFTAPAQPDPDDQFIIPPELEEEVKEIMKQHEQEQQQQKVRPSEKSADTYDTPL